MHARSEDAGWKSKKNRFRTTPPAGSIYPSFDNPPLPRPLLSHHNLHSDENNTESDASSTRYVSTRFSRGIRYLDHENDQRYPFHDRRQHDDHSDCESAMSTSSCGSTRSTRGINYPMAFNSLNNRYCRMQHQPPSNRDESIASNSNYISTRFNRGTHHRSVNNDDRYYARQSRPERQEVKFVLSSSRKRPNNFEDPAEGRNYRITYVGYKYIQGLTEKKPHEIICEIVQSNSPFSVFLNESELEADWLMLVIEILKNICSSSFSGNINEMLNHVLRSQLMHALVYYLNDIETETNKESIAKMKTFIENLTELLSSITSILPLIAVERNVKKVITKTIKAIDIVNSEFQAGVELTFKQRLETLILKIDNYKDMWDRKLPTSLGQQRSYQDGLSEMSPPDDYRAISLHPTYEDLKSSGKFTFLRPNKVKGAYQGVEHYLDVQFRLLREDFIYPLRIGLKEYTEEKAAQRITGAKKLKSKYESVRFYRDAKFESRSLTKSHELGYILAFDPGHRLKISWAYSKRFMFGSLLLFTTNDFETFFYGTVLERDETLLKQGRIMVKLPLEVKITENFFEREYLLAESEVFFEPYFHVMRRLQTLKESEFPLPKFIVFGEVDTERPSYLKKFQALMTENVAAVRSEGLYGMSDVEEAPMAEDAPVNEPATEEAQVNEPMTEEAQVNEPMTEAAQVNEPVALVKSRPWDVLGHSIDLTRDDQWPTASKFKMDESQYEAFKTALTSNFCVIQGPPGTGKTFIGLKIVQVLLKNLKSPRFSLKGIKSGIIESPILIVCYTNHALDQFLEGIVPFTSKIVRAGSRSNSEVLKNFNLRGANQLHIRQQIRHVSSAISSVRTEVKDLHAEIRRLTELREKLQKPCGILRYELLEGVMDDRQKQHLRGEQDVVSWLLPVHENFDYMWYDEHPFSQYDRDAPEVKNKESPATNERSSDDFEDVGLVDELLDFEISCVHSPYCVEYADLETIERDYDTEMERIQSQMMAETHRKTLSELRNERLEVYFSTKCKIREYELLREQLDNARLNVEPAARILQKNIRRLSTDDRWQLYWSWITKVRNMTVRKLNEAEKNYSDKLEQLNECKQIEDVYVVEKADVVGMTTTCAARLHHVLKTVKPAIVVIEEAAEVLESHIVASLTEACQQVILIGDHKQLKPSAAVYHLCKKYNFDVSLFERMINNGMYCPTLRVQHRMRPEISKLITPLIYPNLEDHESVRKFKPVKGMSKSVFFLEHTEFEEKEHDGSSRKNNFEAEFLLKLCEYLVHQGYCPTTITILTTYSGQMFLLREKKRLYPALADVRCIVVDKYQGEENDIILLSLVRSNTDANIGFLKTENRVCVALSRARKGFYMVGNMDNLRASSPLWQEIHKILQTDGASGPEMRLYYEKHELHTTVSKPSDFDKVSQGGCNVPCAELMKCGHVCPSICHKVEHDKIRCYEPCPKTCIRLHPCKNFCCEPCSRCTVEENRKLPCSHEAILACHIDENTYKCEIILDEISPICQHPIKRKCGETPEQTKCELKCGARLDCGHACPRTCHKNDDPDHLVFKCRRDCERLNEKCSKSHQCLKRCFEECGLCTVVEKMTLPCGHEEKLPCYTDLNEHKCYKPCQKSCPDCNGKCKRRCYECCAPCPNLVEKTIDECGHKVTIKCFQEAIRENCSEPCKLLAPCGHQCRAMCSEPCGIKRCYELITTDRIQALCGHNDFVRIQCFQQDQVDSIDREKLLEYCRAPCDTKLKCGDMCVGTCGLCWQGRMHKSCQADCRSELICGHTCKVKCRQDCPPCNEMCGFKCEHSSCPKKCGIPCVKCKEKCKWRCKHLKCTKKCGERCNRAPCYLACEKKLPCSHSCIGYCGEPCPTQCRICNPEITEIFFGWEDESDARFVKLNDCGHVIESKALDKHLQMPPEGGEIVVKACPLCKTPIVTTLRYKNIVRETYDHIINIKRKIFGHSHAMVNESFGLLKRFETLRMNHVNLIRLANLANLDKVIFKFVHFLSGHIRPRWQTNISASEMKALIFFCDAIHTILSHLRGLFDLFEQTEKYDPRRRSRMFGASNSRKVIKGRLDKSTAARKTLTLVQRLMEKIDGINLHLNGQQSEDISLEVVRYTKMVDYCSALRKFAANKNLEQVVAIRPKIEEILFGYTRFVPEQCEAVDRLFQELEKALKSESPLTKEEKQMIHLAMSKDFYGGSQSKGHWFTCTRGHYYCITECGGATQLSKCPECGEKIGGQNHRYVDTIRVASDMDGAAHAAWSAGNDMRNYGRLL